MQENIQPDSNTDTFFQTVNRGFAQFGRCCFVIIPKDSILKPLLGIFINGFNPFLHKLPILNMTLLIYIFNIHKILNIIVKKSVKDFEMKLFSIIATTTRQTFIARIKVFFYFYDIGLWSARGISIRHLTRRFALCYTAQYIVHAIKPVRYINKHIMYII